MKWFYYEFIAASSSLHKQHAQAAATAQIIKYTICDVNIFIICIGYSKKFWFGLTASVQYPVEVIYIGMEKPFLNLWLLRKYSEIRRVFQVSRR